ncbi:hypothetical protein SAMD00023353_3600350 [Rosellinia necatrix]|uniref:Erythromycin esterase n=1 Tax=Rosellinia necatrix TaxID=77044 RepID=A0A1W2TN08_ROSNE|nr:hypothetical protein SAMD00023353_3600350 [Rosellinia necatrix]
MTPRCRRSARIASASKKSRDSPAPQQLTSVMEANESPDRPDPARPARVVNNKTMSSPVPAPTTPSATVPPKLAMTEMHPSKAHQSMAPPSSGLRNGFVDIDYNKTPMQSLIHNTPSKTPAPSSDFTFRYVRSGLDDTLGPAARKMMEQVREQAVALKPQVMEERARELAEQAKSGEGRKIASATGRSSRFSAVHMAEFRKMDSIEGHASSFRAAAGRFTPAKGTTPTKLITPLKKGTKRTQSNADLDEPDSARSRAAPQEWARSVEKKHEAAEQPSKRVRQRMEDDASTLRPVSRDGTSIPRPKSSGNDSTRSAIPRSQTLGSIMTPTKSSLARSTSTTHLVASPSQPLPKVNSFSARVGASLHGSPSKADAGLLAQTSSKKGFGLKIWMAKNNPGTQGSNAPTRIETPGRFDRIKSILKRQPTGTAPKSTIPQPSGFLTKTPSRPGVTESMFPPVPLTTPGQKRDRRVEFTLGTKAAPPVQESPSPVKPSILRSTTLSKIPGPKFSAGGKGATNQEAPTGEVTYPDLSAYGVDEDTPESLPESVPGTFTFRSDHTIRFDSSPAKGFGAAAGQASIRQVRKSVISPTPMPGSFPNMSELVRNKENKDPLTHPGIPHGMINKKRHRASSDEDEEDEGAKRGMKKSRKQNPVAEGHAVVAPKLLRRMSPTKQAARSTPPTPSPQKKKTGLSLSRLQLLAQPKIRK